MLGLRTVEGLDLDAIGERYGVDLAARNGDLIARFVEGDLLIADGRHLHPTRRGLAVADGLAARFEI
jgi:coproporphyrinogen III oxidase-like Fe-S oxidoreductase